MGKVYLVGAGPGAPDLLTLRAARLLARADIVFHDALVHPEVVALARRAVIVPVGKRCGAHSTAQRFINKRLVDAARRHEVVVRLKGGDPMLFGRAQEEIAALAAHGVPCEVVPGVTAALAAAAALRMSLTERGRVRSVAFVTPRVARDDAVDRGWLDALLGADAGAVYMAAGQAATIARALIDGGKRGSLPVVLVENASLPSMRVHHTDLARLAGGAAPPVTGPALLLLGPQFAAAASATGAPGDDERLVAHATRVAQQAS